MVITAAGVPGMRSSVALMSPPLTAPTYIATNSTSACAGCIVYVNGSVSAMSIVPVNPGTAPTMMPSAVPNKMSPSTSGDVNRSTILAFFSVFAENHCAKQNNCAKHKPLKRRQGWRALDLDILQLDAATCDGLLQFIAG